VLCKTVLSSVPVKKIAVVRVQCALPVYAGIRRALLPAASAGLVEIEANQSALVDGLRRIQAATAATALAAVATLWLELAAAVTPSSLRLESGAGIVVGGAQKRQLWETGAYDPGPLGFGLFEVSGGLSTDCPAAILLHELVKEPGSKNKNLLIDSYLSE